MREPLSSRAFDCVLTHVAQNVDGLRGFILASLILNYIAYMSGDVTHNKGLACLERHYSQLDWMEAIHLDSAFDQPSDRVD